MGRYVRHRRFKTLRHERKETPQLAEFAGLLDECAAVVAASLQFNLRELLIFPHRSKTMKGTRSVNHTSQISMNETDNLLIVFIYSS